MNNFTNFTNFAAINEATKRVSNEILTVDDINAYIQAVNKRIPKQVADIIYLTAKYMLCSQKSIDDIRNANKGQLDKIAFNYNIPVMEIENLWKSLKELKANLRLLPQYQTASERSAFMKGKLLMTDITIDLDSSAGRNACAKQYMPMVHKIVGEYVGQSRLGKPELMSAALQGFTDAMNDWRKEGKEDSAVPFKTYAAYRIKQQILADINTYQFSVKTNWYGVKKMGSTMLSAISLDGMTNDDGEFKQDHLAALGTEDPNYNLSKNEEEQWADLYKIIEDTFKQRDIDVFYRYFGLKGHNKEKGKDIAKSLGISPSLIKGIIQDIVLKKLKKNPKAMEILMNLQDSYNESLMLDILNLEKSMMIEAILSDDTFILLEELTKWSNKDVYINTLNSVLDALENNESKTIKEILSGGFDYLDKVFKSNKKLIVKFLGLMNPTDSFARKTDVALLEYMDELSDLYKKYYK
jgi:DNA-directed RNA polymerase specialized sigma subunit